MNYGDLLYRAHENQCNASNSEVRCYKTSFGPPQKLAKSKVSSDNIKKFLARKEEEEKKRQLEAQRRKHELLALRSQDKKAQKRVQVMLKRTKSANKSVMEDAIDNVNTADTLNGPNQCDNDDYGYVSQEASALYSKLMSKYENMPAEPSIFSKGKKEVKDLAAAKDRVKLALQKEAEEAELPHKRKKRIKKDGKSKEELENDTNSEEEQDKSEQKNKSIKCENVDKMKKRKPPAPPPLNFNELLKIAKEKQHEPIVVDTSGKELDTPRLMTSKEKAEYLKEEERKRNRLIRERGGHITSPSISSTCSTLSQPSPEKQISQISLGIKRIPKLSDKEKDDKGKEKLVNNSGKTDKTSIIKKSVTNNDTTFKQDVSERLKKSADVWQKSLNTKLDFTNNSMKKSAISNKPGSRLPSCSKVKTVDRSSIKEAADEYIPKPKNSVNLNSGKVKGIDGSSLKGNANEYVPKPKINVNLKSHNIKTADRLSIKEGADEYVPKPKNTVDKQLSDIDREIQMLVKKKMALSLRTEVSEIADILLPEYIPTSIKPSTKQVSSKTCEKKSSRQIQTKPLNKNITHKKPIKRRIESDSEYDSELDDFIDDGPEEGEDYSSAIKEIFGYDKSRYKDYEDDDECMESNYAQQMREEFVSTKIGIMEDLEDIKKEQEEKRLKAKRMKLKKL